MNNKYDLLRMYQSVRNLRNALNIEHPQLEIRLVTAFIDSTNENHEIDYACIKKCYEDSTIDMSLLENINLPRFQEVEKMINSIDIFKILSNIHKQSSKVFSSFNVEHSKLVCTILDDVIVNLTTPDKDGYDNKLFPNCLRYGIGKCIESVYFLTIFSDATFPVDDIYPIIEEVCELNDYYVHGLNAVNSGDKYITDWIKGISFTFYKKVHNNVLNDIQISLFEDFAYICTIIENFSNKLISLSSVLQSFEFETWNKSNDKNICVDDVIDIINLFRYELKSIDRNKIISSIKKMYDIRFTSNLSTFISEMKNNILEFQKICERGVLIFNKYQNNNAYNGMLQYDVCCPIRYYINCVYDPKVCNASNFVEHANDVYDNIINQYEGKNKINDSDNIKQEKLFFEILSMIKSMSDDIFKDIGVNVIIDLTNIFAESLPVISANTTKIHNPMSIRWDRLITSKISIHQYLTEHPEEKEIIDALIIYNDFGLVYHRLMLFYKNLKEDNSFNTYILAFKTMKEIFEYYVNSDESDEDWEILENILAEAYSTGNMPVGLESTLTESKGINIQLFNTVVYSNFINEYKKTNPVLVFQKVTPMQFSIYNQYFKDCTFLRPLFNSKLHYSQLLYNIDYLYDMINVVYDTCVNKFKRIK